MSRPTYLPWVRAGLIGAVGNTDPLSDPAVEHGKQRPGPLPSRATFQASAVVDAGQTSSVEVRVMGPGDVTGLDPRLVSRDQAFWFRHLCRDDRGGAPPRSTTSPDGEASAQGQ
jgi:hypothetical protein